MMTRTGMKTFVLLCRLIKSNKANGTFCKSTVKYQIDSYLKVKSNPAFNWNYV